MSLMSCNNRRAKQEKMTVSDSGEKQSKADTIMHDRLTYDSSLKGAVNKGIRSGILGIWAAVGDENATFVIAQDKITYPDQSASYEYTLINDSIHIKFDGYDGNYLVRKVGSDTLVLVGDEQQVYYRFKK